MKIGIFDPYLDDLGGGEKYMMMVATCLSKKHDVTIFWDNKEDIEAIKKRFDLSLENILINKDIFAPHVGFFERIKVSKKFDAIIVLSDGSIPFIYPTKLFLHIQQPLPRHIDSGFKSNVKRRHISAIFYNSQFTKKFNDPLFPGVKSVVIYPPVSLVSREQGTGNRQRDNVIVHVGRFRANNLATDDYKKQGFMVDAFKKLVDSGLKDWKFILASSVRKEDEEKFALLKNSAKGYPIEFRVNKNKTEIFNLYHKAKIYWHASGYGEDVEKHPELAEHFGMTTVESMSAGVVPVVIKSGGQKEIVTDEKNGLLWSSFEELLGKTNRLAKDEKLWKELSEQAIIRAQDFSEEKFCEAITKLIA